MRILNLNIEPSAATRRDWRNVCEAFAEFVAETREAPVVSFICLAIILFFLIGPWVMLGGCKLQLNANANISTPSPSPTIDPDPICGDPTALKK
jgi:hypothetical protein